MPLRLMSLGIAALIAAGCPAPELPIPIGSPQTTVVNDITYRVEPFSELTVPVTVGATAAVSNRTERRRTVTFPDGCVVLLRAYRDADRSGAPAWDQRRAVMCTQAIVQARLDPDDSVEYSARATAREILGDSLPGGRYYFTAYLRPDGRVVELPAGQMELRR
jgi:hypothetical protein